MNAATLTGEPAGRTGRESLRPTIRLRAAIAFAGLFMIAGAGLLAVNYAVLDHFLQSHSTRGLVPGHPAVQIIRLDRGILANPHAPALDKAAARGQLALVLAHPTARYDGALLPQLVSQGTAEKAQARDFAIALGQLLRQSAWILVPLSLLTIALGWLVAGRMLRPVRELTSTARQMSAVSLGQRLRLRGPRDELKELGDTFDAMLARLESTFESQRRFVANASHELRTPLTIMRTELEVTMDRSHASEADLRAMGETIRQAVTRSERLVDGLLALAESERGLDRTERVDLAEVAAQALRQITARAGPAGIRLETALSPAAVDGSRVLLERLVENLTDNGVRHNRSGGWLAVQTARRDNAVELVVASTGPPVTPAQAAVLFEPFRRLRVDRTGLVHGSGLGLSIVRAIARAHGGDATAEPVDGGSLRVTVQLPAAEVGERPLAHR